MRPSSAQVLDGARAPTLNGHSGNGLVGGQLVTQVSKGRRGPRRKKPVQTSKYKCCAEKSSPKSTFPRKWLQPRADHSHCHDHGHFSKTCASSWLQVAHMSMLIALCFFAVLSNSVSGVPVQASETPIATLVGQFGSRLQQPNSQSLPRELSNGVSEGQHHHRMSPSLKSFSNLNEDLVFEDSVDVQTSHYKNDQQSSASISVLANGSVRPGHTLVEQQPLMYKPVRVRVDHGHDSFSQVERVALEQSNHPLNEQVAAQYRHMSERIRRFDSLSAHYPSSLDAPKSTLDQLVSNHLVPEPVTDLAPQGQLEPKVNRDILPKQLDLSRFKVLSGSKLTDNSIGNQDGAPESFPQINGSTSEQHSIAGDHILRPFFRKEKKHQQQKLALLGKPLRNKANSRHHLDWSVPVVDLKRLTEHTRTNSPEAFFKKRLPLMSNEEGFILTRPNSSLQGMNVPAERRMDRVNSLPNLTNEFKRRFGDLSHEPNSNHGAPGSESHHHQQGKANNFNPNDPFRMGYLMEDISMNDLDLDDIGPSRMPNGPHNGPKNFKPRKPARPKPQFEPASPNENAPPGQPISQIMPLFFDKFLSEFGNTNPQLLPEGFSLPPNQGKFGPFEQAPQPPGTHANPHMTPPLNMNQMDGDLSDLDAPNQVERRLINGNLALHKVKPEIGPPLFNNDILPSSEFDEFGPWPKIFRFTDGRINLHDFEREKKRSRIKFSQKMSKSQALYNIKRESFLILHGGTFSQ